MKRNPGQDKLEDRERAPPPAAHGGDLGRAIALFGGVAREWLDLSTGVNALPYPIEPPAPNAPIWTRLPDATATASTATAARNAYGAAADAVVTPTAGAQAALQAMPRLLAAQTRTPPRVAIVGATYAEHARAFAAASWRVTEVATLEGAFGAEAAVVVNPNNPDGRRFEPHALLRLRDAVGHLIVDESFMDETPDQSLAAACGGEDLTVLRSLGKFYGLAGLRLGFAISGPDAARRLSALLGPWPVAGPALHFGASALEDAAWARATRRRLSETGPRLRALGIEIGLEPRGGTGLFQSFISLDAQALQTALATRRIWTRIWADRPGWIRLGAPGPEEDWRRLAQALRDSGQ